MNYLDLLLDKVLHIMNRKVTENYIIKRRLEQESPLMNKISDKCVAPWVGSIAGKVNDTS